LRLGSRFSCVGSRALLLGVRAWRAAHWAGIPDASSLSLATQIACLVIIVSYAYDTRAVVGEARRMMWDELREREAASGCMEPWADQTGRKEHGIHTLTVEAEPRFSTPALDILTTRVKNICNVCELWSDPTMLPRC
jgi:hypothetical protein